MKKRLDIFNRICRDLPEGWRIEIFLEEGSGTFDLLDPDGETREYPGCYEYESLEKGLREALKVAKQLDKQEGWA